MCCHDLEVRSSNPGRVELGVLSTSVKSYLNQKYYITVMAEGRSGRDPPPFTLVKSTDSLRKKLNQMRHQQHFTDLIIKCDPVEIPCHKVVITPQCEYFEKVLIQEDMAEMAKQSTDLGVLNSDALLSVIEFLYTGSIEVEFAAAKDVLKVVDYLHLTDTTPLGKLSAYVTEHLNAKNCLGWFDFACRMSMTNVKVEAHNIMLRSFGEVSQRAEFLDLSSTQLVDYMRCKLDEHDTDHDQVLKAVVRWTMHTVDCRREHFEELAMMIDLTKCSADVLKTIYDSHGTLLVSRLSLMQEFTSAALFLANIEQPKSDIDHDTDHDQVLKAVVRWTMHAVDSRKEYLEELAMMVDLTKCSADVLQTIYDSYGTLLISSLPLMQEFTSAALFLADTEQTKHSIIVTGGYLAYGKYNKTFWRLSLKTGKSNEKASHLTDRFGTAICASPKGIICTGDCVLYDVRKDEWVELAPIPVPTYGARAVCVNESSLMVIGGLGERIKKVWCLDFRTGTWAAYPDLLQGVVWAAVGCIDGSVFVVFPTNLESRYERRGSEISLQSLNTATVNPAWSFKAPLPDSEADTNGTQAVTFAGQLY